MKTVNPRWIGNNPAWDIELDNGMTVVGVTSLQIAHRLAQAGVPICNRPFDGIIRHGHIEEFVKSGLRLRVV